MEAAVIAAVPSLADKRPLMTFRVLLIDDDAKLFELLQSYLGPNGVHLTNAPDGSKGLQLLDTQVFDAVLLDVMMPGIDGLEVCRRIRAKSNVPVIMLTARGDEPDRGGGLERGADASVPKPFSPGELLARLRAVLRRSHPEALAETLRVGDISI